MPNAGTDLRDALTGLDAELSAAQQRIPAQHDRIAAYLAEPLQPTVAEQAPPHPGRDRERLLAKLVDAGEHAANFRAAWRRYGRGDGTTDRDDTDRTGDRPRLAEQDR